MVTYLEPDILECEVKWALRSITMNKASGVAGIPPEPFRSLKDVAVKVLHSTCQQIWKTQQWPQGQEMSVFIPIPKKGKKTVQTTIQLLSFHMPARSFSKSFKLSFNSMWTFRKGRRTRDQIANIYWIIQKAREFQKNIYYTDHI